MPVIRIYGTPEDTDSNTLSSLADALAEAAAAIPELQITREQVTTFFPVDRVKKGLGEDVVVFIDLFNSYRRTPVVKQKLAVAVGETVAAAFPFADLVEVIPMGYESEEEGYWSVRRPKEADIETV